ncbi:MAG: hypothetical protein ACE366_14975 [Bradymonadia bacterium]
MEFYVVDPKDFNFLEWVGKVRTFLKEEGLVYSEEDGELYYQGDDIAAAWDERSVVFTIEGDEGGLVELRDSDRNLYVFSDDLDLFEDKEVKDAVGMASRTAGALYGFNWQNQKGCRFHSGPSVGFHYFYDDEEADYPPVMDLEDVWNLFFRAFQWIGDNINHIQDRKSLNLEDSRLDLEVEINFAHPASLDGLNELLAEEEGYERTRSGLRARFADRDIGWVRRFIALLPPEPEDFDQVFLRAVWAGKMDGKDAEAFYVGVERRNLRPFIQLPLHRTSKALMERFRGHFKGHRIDRQEYYLAESEEA